MTTKIEEIILRMELMDKLKKYISPENYKNECEKCYMNEFMKKHPYYGEKVIININPESKRKMKDFMQTLDKLFDAYSIGGELENEKENPAVLLMLYASRYNELETEEMIRSKNQKGKRIAWNDDKGDWKFVREQNVYENACIYNVLKELDVPSHTHWWEKF